MNFSLRPLAIIMGSVAGILAIFTLRHPLISLFVAFAVAVITNGILNLQDKS